MVFLDESSGFSSLNSVQSSNCPIYLSFVSYFQTSGGLLGVWQTGHEERHVQRVHVIPLPGQTPLGLPGQVDATQVEVLRFTPELTAG